MTRALRPPRSVSTVKCYLLHFDPPYKHAQHYVGATRCDDVATRVQEHVTGRGARLVQRAVEAGCRVTLARVWHGAPWRYETQLKGRGLKPLCPYCTPGAAGAW